jgi:hypothetical protein
MKLYILTNLQKQANWVNDFEENLKKGLDELNFPNEIIDSLNRDFLETDFIYVMNFRDLDKIDKNKIKAKIICHSNGSAINQYAYNVNREAEKKQLYEIIDINTTNIERQDTLMKDKYPGIKTLPIGFPLDFEKYEKYKNISKKKKIVVGGRISPDKQFYLATYLLEDLMPEYEVVFSILDKDEKWSNFYDIDRFKEKGFQIRENKTSEEFYNEISDAEFFFTCSLGDTISISLIEAYLCGSYIVAQRCKKTSFPMWDYYHGGYEPFDKREIEKMIRQKPIYGIDTSYFDYKQVCQKLIAGLLQ